jgi:phospholipase C
MKRWPAFILAAALAGCNGILSPAPGGAPSVSHANGVSGGKIQHVIFIIQENRSFDNLFQGYPGADTVPSGKNSKGQTITLQPVSLATQYEIDHSLAAFVAACNGTGQLPGTRCRNNGFDKELAQGPPNPEYVFVPHKESKPYFDMAHEWVLADHMHQSHLDESFVSHQYVIAAQAKSSVNLPGFYWGCDGGKTDKVSTITQQRTIGREQTVCFDYQTLGDELDHAGLTWRFYSSDYSDFTDYVWSGYQAVRHIRYGPDWKKDVITPQKQFLTDVAKGTLENVTWITPTCEESDHVNCGGGYGPSWVSALVNAVGASKFWNSTAIFVMWDDWGGLYDHVLPIHRDYDGVGFRVPLLVISPYAKKDYVSHVEYETGSILRFAEDNFGLAQLAASDTRANDPATDCFDFTQTPRTFVPIKAPKPPSFFMHRPPDRRIPDYE